MEEGATQVSLTERQADAIVQKLRKQGVNAYVQVHRYVGAGGMYYGTIQKHDVYIEVKDYKEGIVMSLRGEALGRLAAIGLALASVGEEPLGKEI